jgi:predicted DNA-binding protein YlxM (UPF0122 family)
LNPEEELIFKEMMRKVEWALGFLSPRQLEVTRLYFGFDTEPMRSMEIAEHFGFTKSAAHHFLKKAIMRMRSHGVMLALMRSGWDEILGISSAELSRKEATMRRIFEEKMKADMKKRVEIVDELREELGAHFFVDEI